MQPSAYITYITHARKPDGSARMPLSEIEALARLDISISDTETTGLSRERHGLTEIASTRAVIEHGQPALKLFQSYILPFRPEYRDYLAACERAAREKKPAPPYDRRRYEYEIDPKALAVTGTEIIRKPLHGPITGLKIKGKRVPAVPLYEVLPDFLAFTREGARDVYYNAPFDLPFLGKLQEDIVAHDRARADAHMLLRDLRGMPDEARKALRELQSVRYAAANPSQQARIVALMRLSTRANDAYHNPASYRCLYHGYLAARGFAASNTLDDAYRTLVDPGFSGRYEHKAVEDVTMTARLALRLTDATRTEIPTLAGLYQKLLQTLDPQATVAVMPPRPHSKQGEPVSGDIQLQFSTDPKKLHDKAARFWDFLQGFDEVTRVNSRAPHHIVRMEGAKHRAVINAERKQPLSIAFLKKCIFFTQLLDSPTIYTIAPFDSTGNRIDVVLHARDASGKRITVEDVHYGSLRANLRFIEAHPQQAKDLLQLIAALRKKDRRVGMVILSERSDGSLDIRIKGHQRAFGECVLHLPAGTPIGPAIPTLQKDLLAQLKLGAIPHVAGFEPAEQDDDTLETLSDSKAASPDPVSIQVRREPGNQMQLIVSESVLTSMAFRMQRSVADMLAQGVATRHGTIAVRALPVDPQSVQQLPYYQLSGTIEAFHDYPELYPEKTGGPQSEKASNLVRDASWLLYRLERLPGTYGLSIQGDMGILDQRDGVSLETLGLLYRLAIPFKAYSTHIKVDVHQLMKNAFHWSVALSRAQAERTEELRAGNFHGSKAPPEFLQVVQHALLRGQGEALEMNEKRECWLVPDSPEKERLKTAHQLDQASPDLQLAFRKKELLVEKSDVVGPHRFRLDTLPDGSQVIHASPVLLGLAARLTGKKTDLQAIRHGEWHINQSAVRTLQPALEKASRFLYELSKSTGSQRIAAQSIDLSPDGTHIQINLPQLHFLRRPRLMDDMLAVHGELAETTADSAIRGVQKRLPDPTETDGRRADLLQLSETIHHEHAELVTLSNALTHYLQLLGGAEYSTDPTSLDLTQELQQELATLGLLLHELAGAGNTLKRVAGQEAWQEVHTAQERISNVAFGSAQLKEDLAVARQAIIGGERSRGLLQEIGTTMATLMDEYAEHLAAYDRRTPVATLMQPYRMRTLSLLGANSESEYVHNAWRAAFRRLRGIALATRDLSDPALRYLLSEAYPDSTVAQQDAIIRLYREKGSDAARAQIRAQFPDSRYASVTGTGLLKQYDLLTRASQPMEDPDTWITHHPSLLARIDQHIAAAYATRGNYYVNQAAISAGDAASRGEYLQRASDCFARAGWDEEKIVRTLARSHRRQFDSNRKAHIRQRIAMEVPPESTNIGDYLRTIDHVGHEERVRALWVAKYFSDAKRETAALTDNLLDPYYIFKQRKALLGSVEKVLKETHDLLMVKYHHVRDLQGLLVMLQQDPAMAARLNDERASQIGEIGQKIRTSPEMVGLHAQTLPHIHQLIETQQDQLRSHMLQQLAEGGAEPVLLQGGSIEITTEALGKMFDQWCQQKNRPVKEVSAHLYPWMDRAAARLFTVPAIKGVTLDKQFTGILCTLELPLDHAARQQAWAQIRLASAGLGLRLPPMPAQGGSMQLSIPFVRTVVRGQVAFDRVATGADVKAAMQAFATSRGETFVARTGKREPAEQVLSRAAARGIDPETILQQLRAAGERKLS